MSDLPAVPTTYAGVNFRSRLEATWAAFFDIAGWTWQYEPVDLAGYIPDFALLFPTEDVIVEVKPAITEKDCWGWVERIGEPLTGAEFLLLGTGLRPSRWNTGHAIGLLRQGGAWAEARLAYCTDCESPTINHTEQDFRCYHCGANDGGNNLEQWKEAAKAWAKAINATQWKPK